MKLTGTVKSTVRNIGSKSERVIYYLQKDEGGTITIRKQGDNPYTNPTLASLDGHHVEAEGDFIQGIFVIRTIRKA